LMDASNVVAHELESYGVRAFSASVQYPGSYVPSLVQHHSSRAYLGVVCIEYFLALGYIRV